MIGVIFIHVSVVWENGFSNYIEDGGAVGDIVNPMSAYFYDSFLRFAVPCFVMLTGAFLLDNDKKTDYRDFYHKAFVRIGIPTIVFTVLYMGYRIIFCFIGNVTNISDIFDILIDTVRGKVYGHMWYMYMIIGVYLLAPIVKNFKESISYNNFRKIAFLFLIFASVSRWTISEIYLEWDVGQSFEYLGFFMMGYVIRREGRNNKKGSITNFVG